MMLRRPTGLVRMPYLTHTRAVHRSHWGARKRHRHDCLIWRETSPQAFGTPTGAYPGRWLDSRACADHRHVSSPWEPVHAALAKRGKIATARVWNDTRSHFGAYVGRTRGTGKQRVDCTHFCIRRGGVYDLWTQRVLEQIERTC